MGAGSSSRTVHGRLERPEPRTRFITPFASSGYARQPNGGAPGAAHPGSDRPSHGDCGTDSVVVVDNRNEVRDFLISRRARITPDQAGLPAYGGNRQVPGLRREEVALLAGVSIDSYGPGLERGNLNGVSESVLEALADALQLDEAERARLFDLARAGNTTLRTRRRTARPRIRPSVQRILDVITDAPAYVRNARRDILAANRLWYALYSEMYRDPARPVNVPDSSSSTRRPVRSSSTGTAQRTTLWRSCASKPAATLTTGP